MKKILLATTLLVVSTGSAMAQTVQDHYKLIINQVPYQVEVCRQVTTSGDKTGDALMGALIGGAIGNNVTKNVDNGGAVGALIGGMIGHSNSKATGGTSTQCQIQTRYKEESKEVYSHSTVTFTDNGKSYTVRFQK